MVRNQKKQTMKNIALTVIFTLALAQIAWAQASGQRKPNSPTDRERRSGIGANLSQDGGNEKNRKALRGGRNSSSGEDTREKLTKEQLGGQKGRPEAGRPGDDGEEQPKKGDNDEQGSKKKKHHHHSDLREIIKKELGLTEEQMERLRVIHTAWHKAVKEIKGKKKFSELSEGAKDRLLNAWRKFRTARAEILSEDQLLQLKQIYKKHREMHHKSEQDDREKGGDRERRKPDGGRPK